MGINEFEAEHKSFSSNKAKDKKHMDKKEEVAEAYKKEAEAIPLGSTEFLNHDSRLDKLQKSMKNDTPSLFALNQASMERISDPRRYYAKKGIKKEFFAQTVEPSTQRFLSVDSESTNHAIALDNYDFFLNHNDEIRTNLARVMLAKLDLDRDSRETLNDLLKSEQWKTASGEEVFFELKNRLRARGEELNDRYVPIFKLLTKAEDLAGQNQLYVSERLRVQNEIYKSISDKGDPLNSISFPDETTKERARALFGSLMPDIKQGKDSIEETLLNLSEKEGNTEANELHGIISYDRSFALQNASDFGNAYDAHKKEKERFLNAHSSAMEKSTHGMEKMAHKSKSYPIAMLAYLTDEDFFLSQTTERERLDVERTIQKELSKITPSGTKTEEFIKGLRESLQAKKDTFEHIYNAKKDDMNTQRQYIPFESTAMHDTAGNIIRDALYIELIKGEDNILYQNLFNQDLEEQLIGVSLDTDIKKHKPNLNEVNDTFNAINMLEKVTMGEVSIKEAKTIFDSPLFQDSTVLNSDEIDGLKDFSTNLAETSKILNSKEIIGTPKDEELTKSIQEMHYLNYTKRIRDKLYPDDKEKNPLKKTSAFIGRNFFQNNTVLYQLDECMKQALNPTTGVETIPSLSKGCIEKLKAGYDKEIQDSQIQGSAKGWLGLTVVGIFAEAMPVIATAKKQMLDKMIDELNAKTTEDSIYMKNARNDYEKMARMMNIQNKEGILSTHIAKTSHVSDFLENIEKEGTVLSLLHTEVDTRKLILENIYEIPKADEESKKKEIEKRVNLINERATSISTELKTLNNDLAGLRSELIDRASKEDVYTDTALAIEKSSLNIHLMEEKLKHPHLLSEQELAEIKENLSEDREALETQRNHLYSQSLDDERFRDIHHSISHTEQLMEKLNDESFSINKERANIQKEMEDTTPKNTIFSINEKRHRTEVALEDVNDDNILSTISSLGTMKNTIDEKIYRDKIVHNLAEKEREKLQRDREKIVKSIEELQKRAILSPALLGASLSVSLSKNYNIDVPSLEEHIGENGVDAHGVNLILESAKDLPKSQRLKIRGDVFDLNVAVKELSLDKPTDNKYSNSVSVLVENIQESEMFEVLKENNDIYAVSDSVSDDKSQVKSANGEMGYYIDRMDKITTEIDIEKDPDRKAELREELSAMVGVGEDYVDRGGVSYSQHQEAIVKSANSANQLDEVNTEVHKTGVAMRRSL